MEKYRLVAIIKHKENKFQILSNKQCQKYFLRILDDGSLMYPTLEEFDELYKIFNANNNLAYMINKDKREENNSNKSKYISLIPKIIHNGVLISLATALILTGCSKSIDANSITSDINEVTSTSNETSKDNIFDIELLPGDILMLREYEGIAFCKDIEEFKKYIDIDVEDPTFEDLKNAVQKNENIDDRYKEWLYTGIDNLESSGINMDLTMLYYNLNRIKIIEVSLDEIREDYPPAAVAYFNYIDGIVGVNKETTNPFEIYHEVLGHGMTQR